MTSPTNGDRYEQLIADAAHSMPVPIHCTQAGVDCMRSMTGMIARQMGIEAPTVEDHTRICADIEEHLLNDIARTASAVAIVIIPNPEDLL